MKPFFIVGAPRSGTTMLRDMLKNDKYYSPEETHFYRWSEPFGSKAYFFHYKNNVTLNKHREIDGVSDEVFWQLYEGCFTRKDLNDRYCSLVANSKSAQTWFEKTPQNIYLLPLLAVQQHEKIIIHIYRSPYDVIKSLMVGKVLKVSELIGATNYWLESMQIVEAVKPYLGDRLVEICYEDLVGKKEAEVLKLEKAVGYKVSDAAYQKLASRISNPSEFFSREQLDIINEICNPYIDVYEYKKV
jgi:hypothetical protein